MRFKEQETRLTLHEHDYSDDDDDDDDDEIFTRTYFLTMAKTWHGQLVCFKTSSVEGLLHHSVYTVHTGV